MRKLALWLLLAVAVLWMFRNPAGAAAAVHQALAALSAFASHL